MAANTFINDGSIAFGSIDITISAVVYPTEDFKLDYDIARFVSHTSKNIPRGKVVTAGEITGSFTAILPTSATASPKMGDAFTATLEDSTTVACHIEKAGRAKSAGGEVKIACTFSVDIGTVVVT